MRSRQRSQAIVEFGIVALLFTLIAFAVVDFGLLLNNWLAVSSGARALARDAAVGMYQTDLDDQARALRIPGVTADPRFAGGYCCLPTSAIVLDVTYFDHCTPGVGLCNEVPIGQLDNRYRSHGTPGTCIPIAGPPPVSCPHPSPPRQQGTCGTPPPGLCQGDTVRITLAAAGAQVITPLVRPFFARANECPDNSSPSRCYVPLSSTVVMRYEGNSL
jgi:hypothetical protein